MPACVFTAHPYSVAQNVMQVPDARQDSNSYSLLVTAFRLVTSFLHARPIFLNCHTAGNDSSRDFTAEPQVWATDSPSDKSFAVGEDAEGACCGGHKKKSAGGCC